MKRFKYIDKISIALLVAAIFTFGYIYTHVLHLENKLLANIQKSYISHTSEIARNIDSYLNEKVEGSLLITLKSNPSLRAELERTLSLFITSTYKYIFIAYKDQKGRYRYLLDGSLSDKGFFNQKLDVKKSVWNRVYATKKPDTILHHESKQIFITYLYPIVRNGTTQAILAIDFSSFFPQTIAQNVEPLKQIVFIVIIALALLLFFLVYQFILLQRTKKASLIDPLTLVYNRTFLREFLDREDFSKYYILMADVDHFKKINDNYGHKVGDQILYQVAQTIHHVIRPQDILVRYGGEEFLIFIPKEIPETKAVEIANRIKESIESKIFHVEDHNLKLTISIGVNLHPEHYKNVSDALKEADNRLYEAKRGGRNRIVHTSKISKETPLDIHEIEAALNEDRIFCLYQPIIDLNTNKPIKYEALVRLKSKEGKTIPPYLFLDQIAYTTAYLDLTQKVLQLAFDTIKKKGHPISINLKFSDIADNKIFEIILQEIDSHKELASKLTIELLESEALDRIEIIKEHIKKIRSYNVTIAIDDFGSGYSNFDIFRHLPIDILKIDGSLVKNITTEKISLTTIKSIQIFAKELGIRTVAEYVENKEIVEAIKALGITYAQGYYFSPPKKL